MACSSNRPKAMWQPNKSLAECNRQMLEEGIASDVTLLVSCDSDNKAGIEEKKFSAHKYMLISRSPVFETMFCGVLEERGEVKITDVDPQAFKLMLNYIYTDEPELSHDLVMHVLNASKKYILPGLTTKCNHFINAELTTENVCTILDENLLFEENDLDEFCLNLIMQETNKVLQTEAFLSISSKALSKILEINTCELKEVDLIKYCLNWAQQKCVEEKKEATNINIREALGGCIMQFRFSDAGDFARDICPLEVLTKDEEHGIMRHLADKQAIPAPTGFLFEARLKPNYTVETTEKIQQIEAENFDFTLTINNKKNTNIKVCTLLIGKVGGYGYRINYNYVIVNGMPRNTQDETKLQIICNSTSQFTIPPGFSTLQIVYYKGTHGSYATNKSIYGIPRKAITLIDCHRIELDVRATEGFFIPLLGLTYEVDSS